MIFRQLFDKESSTYTYLLADPTTREALLIDPVLEKVDRDLKLIGEMGLKLLYSLETHVHADHITGAGKLREKTGCRVGVCHAAGVDCADLPLAERATIQVGPLVLRVLETPGHTDTCLCYVASDRVFTGDTLFVRGCGRTDFQSGSAESLYDSVTEKLFRLPDTTLVFPGHDYNGFSNSTIGEEKRYNPRLTKSRTDFVKFMREQKLEQPKRIHEAVPANLRCGLT